MGRKNEKLLNLKKIQEHLDLVKSTQVLKQNQQGQILKTWTKMRKKCLLKLEHALLTLEEKKAKRKAREKQMEEARRLAQLQKKRELKAAGIDVISCWKTKKEMDYNKEVPFERKPPKGLANISEEKEQTRNIFKEFKRTTIEEIEGKKRKAIEAALRKKDVKCQLIGTKTNSSNIINKISKDNTVEYAYMNTKLMLPNPKISISDLKTVVKLQNESINLDSKTKTQYKTAHSTIKQTNLSVTTCLTKNQHVKAANIDSIFNDTNNNILSANSNDYSKDFTGIMPFKRLNTNPDPINVINTKTNDNISNLLEEKKAMLKSKEVTYTISQPMEKKIESIKTITNELEKETNNSHNTTLI